MISIVNSRCDRNRSYGFYCFLIAFWLSLFFGGAFGVTALVQKHLNEAYARAEAGWQSRVAKIDRRNALWEMVAGKRPVVEEGVRGLVVDLKALTDNRTDVPQRLGASQRLTSGSHDLDQSTDAALYEPYYDRWRLRKEVLAALTQLSRRELPVESKPLAPDRLKFPTRNLWRELLNWPTALALWFLGSLFAVMAARLHNYDPNTELIPDCICDNGLPLEEQGKAALSWADGGCVFWALTKLFILPVAVIGLLPKVPKLIGAGWHGLCNQVARRSLLARHPMKPLIIGTERDLAKLRHARAALDPKDQRQAELEGLIRQHELKIRELYAWKPVDEAVVSPVVDEVGRVIEEAKARLAGLDQVTAHPETAQLPRGVTGDGKEPARGELPRTVQLNK